MRIAMRRLGLWIVTVLLMLATCELASRTFSVASKNLTYRDTDVGRRYFPDLNKYIYSTEARRPILFQTHELGFRGTEIFVPKPNDVKRIVVVGDSYTASEALIEEQTFCHQLRIKLDQQAPSQKWEVLNFGIPGSGTGQELALYRNQLKELNPDVLLVAFGNATDVRDNSRELGSNPIIQFDIDERGELYQIAQSDNRVTLSNYLNQYSRFYGWQKRKVNQLMRHFRKQVASAGGRHLILASEEPPKYTRAWSITSSILRQFEKECAQNGTQLLLVAIPSAFQIYPDRLDESRGLCDDEQLKLDPMHPDNRLTDICRQHGIPMLSLVETFVQNTPSRTSKNESEHLFLGGCGHLNPEGSELVGHELCEWILESNLVPSEAGSDSPISESVAEGTHRSINR